MSTQGALSTEQFQQLWRTGLEALLLQPMVWKNRAPALTSMWLISALLSLERPLRLKHLLTKLGGLLHSPQYASPMSLKANWWQLPRIRSIFNLFSRKSESSKIPSKHLPPSLSVAYHHSMCAALTRVANSQSPVVPLLGVDTAQRSWELGFRKGTIFKAAILVVFCMSWAFSMDSVISRILSVCAKTIIHSTVCQLPYDVNATIEFYFKILAKTSQLADGRRQWSELIKCCKQKTRITVQVF